MKAGVEGLAPFVEEKGVAASFMLLRFGLAAALYPLFFPRVLKELNGRVLRHAFFLALPLYAGFLPQIAGLRDTTATVSAFLTSLTVAVTPILGRLFFREKLAGATLAGVAVALAGVYVLTDPRGGGFGRGEILSAACALAFAVQIQLTNVVTSKSPPEAVTFGVLLFVVAFSAALTAACGTPIHGLAQSLREPRVAGAVLYNALACSIVAGTVMNRFQRHVSPTRAAVLYTTEPVFAALFALVFTGEEMTPRKIVGGAIILGGNLLCERFRNMIK